MARSPKGRWAAVIPPGGFQSAAHRRCGHGVLNPNIRSSSAKGLDQAERGQALDVRLKVSVRILDPYLFLSPGGGGAPPTWRQEAEFCRFVPFFCDFGPSKLHSKFCIEKTSKKVRKWRILASQNPPKMGPKCLQNRCSKKHAILHRFFLEKASVAKAPTSISYWFFQYFLLVGHVSSNRLWDAFFVPKTYQKPFQNDVRSLPKSMPKTCCLLT